MAAGGGSSRLLALVELIDRYGEAVEADLHKHYGLDLLDFFRGRWSWAKLHRLIGQLPGHPAESRLALARSEDDELAEAVLKHREAEERAGKAPEKPLPPVETYTPVVAALMAAIDRLTELAAIQIAAAGGKPPTVRPLPRPKTALDRAEESARDYRHLELVAEVEEAQARYAD